MNIFNAMTKKPHNPTIITGTAAELWTLADQLRHAAETIGHGIGESYLDYEGEEYDVQVLRLEESE